MNKNKLIEECLEYRMRKILYCKVIVNKNSVWSLLTHVMHQRVKDIRYLCCEIQGWWEENNFWFSFLDFCFCLMDLL